MLRFACPACGKTCKAPEDAAGRRCRCPRCNGLMQIPPATAWLPPAVAASPDVPPPVRLPPAVVPPPEPPPRQTVILSSEMGDWEPEPHLRVPRFTVEGALVKCPHCREHIHVREKRFNRPTGCANCGGFLVAVVAAEGKIPFDCHECGCEMEISERKAGRPTRCANCDYPLTVPTDPIKVVRTTRRPDAGTDTLATLAVAGLAGLVIGAAVASGAGRGPAGGRRCLDCGRGLRNPTNYCHLCQKRRGLC